MLAGLPSIGLLAVAMRLGPHSCDPGVQETYLGLGVGYLLVLAAIPFLAARAWSVAARSGTSALLVVAGAGVWVGGFALGGFRLICRLF